jgi:NAD-dependent SIR2 family protein deacetylase
METGTCQICRKLYQLEQFRTSIEQEQIPMCTNCGIGVIKPDIVFFKESLGDHVSDLAFVLYGRPVVSFVCAAV